MIPQKILDPNVYKDNDYEAQSELSARVGTTGDPGAVSGIADLYLWLSATPSGAEIHASLKVLAAERSGNSGVYFGIIPGAAITAQLFPAYADKDIYLVAGNTAGNVKVNSKVRCLSVRKASH